MFASRETKKHSCCAGWGRKPVEQPGMTRKCRLLSWGEYKYQSFMACFPHYAFLGFIASLVHALVHDGAPVVFKCCAMTISISHVWNMVHVWHTWRWVGGPHSGAQFYREKRNIFTIFKIFPTTSCLQPPPAPHEMGLSAILHKIHKAKIQKYILLHIILFTYSAHIFVAF